MYSVNNNDNQHNNELANNKPKRYAVDGTVTYLNEKIKLNKDRSFCKSQNCACFKGIVNV